MSGVTRVHRILIDSYPTPDGKPFDLQHPDDYDAAVDYFHNPIEENAHAVPEWLAGIDLSERIYGDDYEHGYPQPGVTIMSGGDPLLTVPTLRRVNFFSRQAAERRLSYLAAWGAIGRVVSSAPIEWPAP
jgi:hypothetical protein